jgi:hypothetical protein
LKRFDETLECVDADARRRFFSENYIDLMGAGLAPALRRPQPRETMAPTGT